MGGITGFALGTSRLTVAVIALVIVAGLAQFVNFPRQEDPPIVIREAVVSVLFPGLAPAEMEDLVTRKVEAEIRKMPEVDEITSDTTNGQAVIHVTTRDEFDDLDQIWQSLRNRMLDLRPELPRGTIGPFVNDEFGLVAVATIALWADGFDMADMRLVARDLRDRLYELQGIRKVELFGVQQEWVRLKFSNSRLGQFGLSGSNLIETLTEQNVVLPGGHVDAGGPNVVVQPSGSFTSLDDVRNVLVQIPADGSLVPLRDLVEVERSFADPPRDLAYFNGEPTIVISVSIVPGVNSVDFGDRLTAKIREFERTLPVGYALEYATFQPDLVVAAVNGALSNVYQTLVIVLVVVMLFLGLRTGLIVGSFVPITILLGLLIMRQFDIELERVSIISAIVALGMLVDNAIVVAEDIRSRLERGQERRAACIEAGQTLAVPLLTSSLTTILAFMPILLMDGSTGDYAFSLPMVVVILLLSSWFMAMYMTPAMCFWFMKLKPKDDDGQAAPGDPYDTPLYRRYRAFLERAIRARYVVIAITALLLAGAALGAGLLVREFFGPSDRNQFLVYLDLPAGYRITATNEMAQRVMGWLNDESENPEVTSTITYVGNGGPRFFLSLSPVDPAPNVTFTIVNTAVPDDVPVVLARLRRFLAENVPEANPQLKRMWMGANEPALVEYRLVGTDSEHLFEQGKKLVDALSQVPGIDYVHNDWENKVPFIDVVVDQARARRVGVTSREVALSLQAFLDGKTVTEYREGDLAIPVLVQSIDEEREVLGDLWNVNVRSAARGINIPLTQVAVIQGGWQFATVARKDQERTLTVATRHRTLRAPELIAEMQPVLDGLELKPGHRWELGARLRTPARPTRSCSATCRTACWRSSCC